MSSASPACKQSLLHRHVTLPRFRCIYIRSATNVHRNRPFLNLVHLPLDLTLLPSMPFYLLAPFPVPEETLTTYLLICDSSVTAFLTTHSIAPVHLLDNLRGHLEPAVYKSNSICPLPGVSVCRLPYSSASRTSRVDHICLFPPSLVAL